MPTRAALILAAGRGSRMGCLTELRPKPLAEFAGRTLLDWQRLALRKAGIEDIAVVVGYRAEMFEHLGLTLLENPDWAESNMVTSLMAGAQFLERFDQVLVCYGDIVYEPRVISALCSTPGDIVITADSQWLRLWDHRFDSVLDDAETFSLAEDETVADIGLRPNCVEEIEAQYMGLIHLTRKGWAQLQELFLTANNEMPWLGGRSVEQCHLTDLLRGAIQSGIRVNASIVSGGWLEFDSERDLNVYERLDSSGELADLFDKAQVASP